MSMSSLVIKAGTPADRLPASVTVAVSVSVLGSRYCFGFSHWDACGLPDCLFASLPVI